MLLSIVVATTQPWPEIEMTLDSLFDQAVACGAEIIVVDGTGHGLPEQVDERYPGVVWLRPPVRSAFELRWAGVARALGDIVAVTEDHCTVGPTWCANVIRAHQRHPDAAAVGGPVENGFPSGLKSWAHHFLVFGPAVPPIDEERPGPMWSSANISYKRRVLPAGTPAPGPVELFFMRELQARGERFVADPSVVARHYQTFPLSVLATYHFHNGRTIAAARLPRLSRAIWLARVLACGLLPAYLIGLRWRHVWRKPTHRATFLGCLPWLALLATAHAWGELAGYLAGAGTSPESLR
jgi:hypothetical protein